MKNNIYTSIVFLFVFFHTSIAFSQYNETIRTGRPGEAIGPFAVGARVFQVQAGVGYFESAYNYNTNADQVVASSSFLSGAVIRVGITEHFELNSLLLYENTQEQVTGIESTNSGISGLAFGLRSNIYVGKGWVPSVGFQLSIGMPWLSSAFNSAYVRPRLTLITNQQILEKWALTTNWGLFWNGNSADPSGFYVVNVSYSATEKWSLFVEAFGVIKSEMIEPHIDGGGGYLVNNNLQLDLSAGLGWGDNEYNDWFVNAGLSWRMRFNERPEQ